ncbi:MAG TPA: serine hydrolase [Thermoanaerobaculia bacterium]
MRTKSTSPAGGIALQAGAERNALGVAKFTPRRKHLTAVALLLAFFLTSASLHAQVPPFEQDPPPPPEEQTENAVSSLREIQSALESMLETRSALPPVVGDEIRQAHRRTEQALDAYLDLDPQLPRVGAAIEGAARHAEQAARLSRGSHVAPELDLQASRLAGVARLIAVRIVERAAAGGVDRRKLAAAGKDIAAGDELAELGDHSGAAKAYNKNLPLKNALSFDPALFRASIDAALLDKATGYALALNRNGNRIGSWGVGLRQNASDASPAIAMLPSDEINIASVSKTITAAAVLRVLQNNNNGGDIDAVVQGPIGAYIPRQWFPPVSVREITFVEMMKHQSGLGGRNEDNVRQGCGTRFTDMDGCSSLGVDPGDKGFFYNNANFSFFRAMLGSINGLFCELGGCTVIDDEKRTEYYRYYVQCHIFTPMGISPNIPSDFASGCGGPEMKPSDTKSEQALYYYANEPLQNGMEPDDWTTTAGGGGWYLSADELARFLAYLRYDNKILAPATRKAMYSRFLGFMDPDQYGFADGVWGPNRMHGGDLCYATLTVPPGVSRCDPSVAPQGVSTCIADFPDGTQASLVINSKGWEGPYQCSMLKSAYEAAWVVK